MPNIFWFLLITYEDSLIYFVLYDSKLYMFGFWIVGLTQKNIYRCHIVLWEIAIFHNFLINQLIKKTISILIYNEK